MDYKKTLNLPKTDFPMKANLPAREPLLLKDWERDGIYGKIQSKRESAKPFILHDGPPYANGDIHMGHALNKILKDIVVKFKTMKGYRVPFMPGWDCHGLPVEHQLMKELNVEKGGVEQPVFRSKAGDYALKYVDIQRSQFKRLGIFADWDNPYLTLQRSYESGIVKSLASLVGNGYVYKGLKPVNWCYKCETALAEAEVEYSSHKSLSVFVKFPLDDAGTFRKTAGDGIELDDGKEIYVLIWTTTPWTLLANVAIAVSPEMEYALIESRNEYLIFAVDLIDSVASKTGLEDCRTIKVFRGTEIDGLLCSHPFIDRKSRIVLADYVSHEEGTGCVHTAPGHGQEDYLTGMKYGLPMIMPVDSKGRFDETAGVFSGMHVFEANSKIADLLKDKGALLGCGEIEHSYPHCWRCKKPIIFRATSQYFIKIDHRDLRKNVARMIEECVKWIPYGGKDRIGNMVINRPDWCISRQRLWGVPIPAFYCSACKRLLLNDRLVNRVADIFAKEGSDSWFTKDASYFLPEGTRCPDCGHGEFEKESDILDVWFESGVSHQSVLKPRGEFPADLYLEGSDQHRGWFQSSIVSSAAIEGKSPFKAVLTHGFVVDGEGRKMSKSVGNVISPAKILKRYGADILRLWVASCDYRDDVRISDEIISRLADAYRKIRNTCRFILGNIHDFDPEKDFIPIGERGSLDRWAFSRVAALLETSEENYAAYSFHKVAAALYNFCVIDMSSVYLDVLKDTLYVEALNSTERRGSQSTLWEILEVMTHVMAPLLVYTSEEVRRFAGTKDSIHAAKWPDTTGYLKRARDHFGPSEENEWNDMLLPLREGCLKYLEEARGKGLIGSSLQAKVLLKTGDKAWKQLFQRYQNQLSKFLIVSEVRISEEEEEGGCAIGDFPVTVKVEKADGAKCERCWNYSLSVGKDKKHPSLCNRCLGIIRRLEAQRLKDGPNGDLISDKE